jgi:hypothetical protein
MSSLMTKDERVKIRGASDGKYTRLSTLIREVSSLLRSSKVATSRRASFACASFFSCRVFRRCTANLTSAVQGRMCQRRPGELTCRSCTCPSRLSREDRSDETVQHALALAPFQGGIVSTSQRSKHQGYRSQASQARCAQPSEQTRHT